LDEGLFCVDELRNPHRGSGKMMMFCINVVYCFNVSPKFSKEKLDEGLFCFDVVYYFDVAS
jgi:hypothetical protein